MPSDMKQRSSRHQPNRTNLPISLTKLLILLFLTICYSLIAIHNNYPPYNWIDKYLIKKNETPARPAGFVRYSDEHKYRPAASPIIKRVGKNGKIELHGQYHD